MKAILTEKPSVAIDIARVLKIYEKHNGYLTGNGYMITWALGHLVALANPDTYEYYHFPMIPTKFKLLPRTVKTGNGYEPDKAAVKQLKVIAEVFSKCDEIIVATDAGREGELIFRYVYQYLHCKKPFSRLWINSMTDKAIIDGFKHLRDGNDFNNLYLAAEARSKADWLIGMNASQALFLATNEKNNSLGRVQTPTLAMICNRYLQNTSFKSLPYWVYKILIEKNGQSFRMTSKEKVDDKVKADAFFKSLAEKPVAEITKIEQKEVSEKPPLLYDLTSLQKDANKRHGLTAEQTLSIAQKLYESKLISYPRVDCRYIPEDVFSEIPSLIRKLKDYPEFSRQVLAINLKTLCKQSVSNEKITDHHALIITDNIPENLKANEQTVYEMIAGRMLEAFSTECTKKVLTIEAVTGNGMRFEARKTEIIHQGWRDIFNFAEENEDDEPGKDQPIPEVSEGESFHLNCFNKLQKATKPKPLFTEASLLAAMETAGRELENEEEREAMKKGIGTPATRANTIETLFKRNYIERDKKNLVPTQKGMNIFEAIKDKQIANVQLTGRWEHELSKIETDPDHVGVFNEAIKQYTMQIADEITSVKVSNHLPEHVCPKCRLGKVTIYSKVAKCNNTKCNFIVFRNISGKLINEWQVSELLKKGKSPVIKGFKRKNGRGFQAALTFDENCKVIFEPKKPKE